MIFENASLAFEDLCYLIISRGIKHKEWYSIYNTNIILKNPMDNIITTSWRNFKESYAEKEWMWYLSEDQSPAFIGRYAKKWNEIADKDGLVNSNYGYWWNKEDQLDNIIKKLQSDKDNRQAVITIYDGKIFSNYYGKDCPCTLNICLQIVEDKLNMTVMMRSNDLWFGFCNDQYCFSRFQDMVSKELSIEMGSYTHYAVNLHLYNNHFKKVENEYSKKSRRDCQQAI